MDFHHRVYNYVGGGRSVNRAPIIDFCWVAHEFVKFGVSISCTVLVLYWCWAGAARQLRVSESDSYIPAEDTSGRMIGRKRRERVDTSAGFFLWGYRVVCFLHFDLSRQLYVD